MAISTRFGGMWRMTKGQIEILKKITEFISKNSLQSPSPKETIYAYFQKVKEMNKDSVSIREKRKRLRDDLGDLERCYCKGDSFDNNGGGYNNGMKINTEEQRQIAMLKLREELKTLTIDNILLEKQNQAHNDLCKSFIELLKSKSLQDVLKCLYILGMRPKEIAIELGCSYDTIKEYRKRGVNQLTTILFNYTNLH